MDYDSLRIFLHLADTLHFGRTSRECFLTPSALSRIIQRLEKETGRRLFERDNRTVRITEDGLRFREFAYDALGRWRLFKETPAEGESGIQGEVSIYCSVTASFGILKDILGAFRLSRPGVYIRLKTGEEARAIQMLQDGAADISIAAKPDRLPADIEFVESAVTPLLIIAPVCECEASDALRMRRPWTELPLILPEHGVARKRIDELFVKNGKKLNVYADVSGNEAIIAMVSLGCGIGLVPELVLAQSPHRKDVRVLNVKTGLKPYQVGFCVHKTRLRTRAVQAFWDECGKRPSRR